ncbi:MAG: PRTRC system ParB family protein [Sphingomonas sp.]|uniref:PRTRC system ParB family protein n=1 Tax=Sphingomonas sp. TaxID=28214 RepID=UPI00258648C5|nr:PRTRC system ParB family protein [Sphingomonas sp.]MCP4025701.1 PRTRC system ParB family protein [Sphingomonas sp.]
MLPESTNLPAAPAVTAEPDVANALLFPLSRIKPGANPRRYFDPKKHAELVASLKLRGILQPLLVRPDPADADFVQIVAGERRHRAAVEAFGAGGSAPVFIRDMTDSEALEAAIDENDARDDASETEQADAAVRHLAACGDDRAEAARRLGWSRAKLDRRLALANLDEAVKAALDERRIKVGHAELLAVVPPDKQAKALDTILTAALDVNKTREILTRMTQSLAAAIFDKTECLICPFNSGSQRALFETHVDDGHCTNPGCYQLKSEAAAETGTTPVVGNGATDAPAPSAAAAAAAPAASPRSSKPASKPAPAPAPAVTAASMIATVRTTILRDAAWRAALIRAAEGDPAFGDTFEAVLRGTWQVDAAFLTGFGKEELKFIAMECGLVEHMGARKFAKLLEAKVPDVIAGMLNAKGFDWAGRLPSVMTITGTYSPSPPAAPSTDKD